MAVKGADAVGDADVANPIQDYSQNACTVYKRGQAFRSSLASAMSRNSGQASGFTGGAAQPPNKGASRIDTDTADGSSAGRNWAERGASWGWWTGGIIGGVGTAVASVPADIGSAGGNVPFTPAEVMAGFGAGARTGSLAGWGIGTAIDMANGTPNTHAAESAGKPPDKIGQLDPHAVRRMNERGVSWQEVQNTFNNDKNPQWQEKDQTWLYRSKTVVIAVNKYGKLITTWRVR